MYIGIELGSTRIKAVGIDKNFKIVSQGDYTWKSTLKDSVWTYDLDEACRGVTTALKTLLGGTRQQADVVGISAMMHGYLAFDKDWNLLVPFRSWQNTMTAQAAEILSKQFNFNIQQRWSIAHLYQAILNKESHIKDIAHITTLAGYIHFRLTGQNVVGKGEASGIFPLDSQTLDYDQTKIAIFEQLIEKENLPWKITDLLPRALMAGEDAGSLTENGSRLIDGLLPVGTRFCPCEGDADTGMTATNAIRPRTGNISAGTSIFSMVVLEKPLSQNYSEVGLLTTPTGKPVAMVHCSNCTSDFNSWVNLFGEVATLFGVQPSKGELYDKLICESLNGDVDCNGVITVNYLSGESVTHLNDGRPFVTRTSQAKFNLANLVRSQLYSTMVTLKMGMDILARENVAIDKLIGHGGLFKTEGVCQNYLAAACNAEVSVMETAGEGGPYGMALLASFVDCKGLSLEDYLSQKVFADVKVKTVRPDENLVEGFDKYTENFKKALDAEATLIKLK